MNCKDCKHFARGGSFDHTNSVFDQAAGRDLTLDPSSKTGFCLHPLMYSDHVNGWMGRPYPESPIINGVEASCDEQRGDLVVGEMFGCIHFEVGVCPNKQHFNPLK